jgi:hypothetical protein
MLEGPNSGIINYSKGLLQTELYIAELAKLNSLQLLDLLNFIMGSDEAKTLNVSAVSGLPPPI